MWRHGTVRARVSLTPQEGGFLRGILARARRTRSSAGPSEESSSSSGSSAPARWARSVELEQPIVSDLDVVGRVFGMYRVGNVLATSELSEVSSIVRETLGFAYALDRNFRLKTSVELWEFSGRDPVTGRTREVSLHLRFVGTF
jgi:hypothetical protein